MNYYDPLVVFWFDDPGYATAINDLFLEFNQTLEDVYVDFDVPVADVAGAFATADFSLDPDTGLPVNVGRACAWTWIWRPLALRTRHPCERDRLRGHRGAFLEAMS